MQCYYFGYFWPRTVSTFDKISIYVRKYDFKTPWNILEPSRSAFYMSRKREYASSFLYRTASEVFMVTEN